ncbi:hypothetical protein KC207_11310 [Phycicoccus sp. BSK3Z-2]|uniref:Serine/threonine protein kinase n=1 Tax=Phycicoccus avicenniae TaxID=2828860 RepID=A0A941D8L7_9MICO|nr:hypothetical protein [Phycicoccus avicenniae]MBR7743878.1 hypothetical protein [Phycicoccus avicenniae]
MRHPTVPTAAPFAALLAAGLLGGCAGADPEADPSPTATPSPSATSPSASPTPEPTETDPSPSPSETSTPLPTLTPEETAAPPTPTPTPRPTATGGTDAAPRVPAPFRGVWTAVEDGDEQVSAADCERGGATAGRVIEVTDRTIEYFETRGTLRAVAESSPTRFRATFGYPDPIEDGPDTLARVDLTLRDGGRTLVVAEEDQRPALYRSCAG